jgi:hypothetical protein
MLKRVIRFVSEHPITPANPRAVLIAAEVDSAIVQIEASAHTQMGGRGEAAGGLASKEEKARELRAFLKGLARTARVFDRESHPGLAEQFVLPTTRSYPKLLGAARAMIAAATRLEEVFIEHAMPVTFLADATAWVAEFEVAMAQTMDGRRAQVCGTAGLLVHAAKGVQAAKPLPR